jgi:hypothetical protein
MTPEELEAERLKLLQAQSMIGGPNPAQDSTGFTRLERRRCNSTRNHWSRRPHRKDSAAHCKGY